MTRPSPRVLLVWDEHWPRALLRAQLIEDGFDAVGAASVAEALRQPVVAPDRGPVRVIVVDQRVASTREAAGIPLLQARHPGSKLLLLARAGAAVPEGNWDRVLARPVTIATIARAVEAMVGGEGEAGRSALD